MSNITENESGQYLIHNISNVIHKGITTGYFQPTISIEDLSIFMVTSIDGIVRDVLLQKCYGVLPIDQMQFDEIKLMNTLCKSVLLLLGAKEGRTEH